jgi:hypothetical protein
MATKTYRGPFGNIAIDVDTEKQAQRRAAIGSALKAGAGTVLVDVGQNLQGQDRIVAEVVDTGRRYASGNGMSTGLKVLVGLTVLGLVFRAAK